ncbi:MAG: oligosaccharide flippase family protein [Candidatus Latescibacteria bacterium]|nr:oligosaccharide flippase family protein [Candidatus Latescibacterota bacterium]
MARDETVSEPQESAEQKGDQSFSGKVIRNTLFNTLGHIWSMGIRFYLTPYVALSIGNERYGIWGIVGILSGYFSLLDLGLARSFDKYLAEYYTKQDYESFNKVLSIGFIYYIAFSLVMVGAVLLFYAPIMDLLKWSPDRLDQEVMEESQFAIIWSIVIFGYAMTSSVFGMVMTGLQRMDVINKIGMVSSLLTLIGTYIVIESGYGLRGLVINNGVIAIVGSIITLFAAYRIYPQLRINPFRLDWTMFRRMFSFGTKLQVAKLANLLTFQIDRPLVSRYLHVGLTPPYHFAAGFIGSVRTVLLMIPSAVIPATSELEARDEDSRSREFYERGTRYLLLISTPVCVFSAVAASLIMWTWLGRDYEMIDETILLIQIVVLGYYANLSTGVATGIAVGMGRPDFEMKFGVLLGLLSVVLSVTLIQSLGFYGPAIAITISLTVSAVYFYRLFHQFLGRPLLPFLQALYSMPLAAGGIAGIVVFCVQLVVIPLVDPVSRFSTFSLLCGEGILFTVLYCMMILRTSYLDAYDRALFQRYMAKLRP